MKFYCLGIVCKRELSFRALWPFADMYIFLCLVGWCAIRVRDEALVVGAADWRLELDAAASCGIIPGPGGPGAAALPPAPPPTGGRPPVGGPFCAIAREVPPTSSTMIASFHGGHCHLQCLSRAHPDMHMERRYEMAVPARADKTMASNYEELLIFMSQKRTNGLDCRGRRISGRRNDI